MCKMHMAFRFSCIFHYLADMKKQTVILLACAGVLAAGFVVNSALWVIPQPEVAARPTVKYGDLLHLPEGMHGYFDYEEGMAEAARQKKPVLVCFVSFCNDGCRKILLGMSKDETVMDILEKEYVVIALFCDAQNEVAQEDRIVNERGDTLRTLGRINSYLGRTLWGINATPIFLICDNDGKPALPFISYDKAKDMREVAGFLRQGAEACKQLKK